MPAGSRIDAELVCRGFARSREHAAALVAAGRVRVDGRTMSKPAQRVRDGSDIEVAHDAADRGYASRGAYKLHGALEEFGALGLSIRGRRCVDVGTGTGGFTDVLLRAGVVQVVCVDVGHDQLVRRLREDPRTVVLEGLNVRDLVRGDVARPVDVVVADVSFISLTLVLPAVAEVAAADGDMVLMVKPQFEVGRDRLGTGGVVRTPELRREAVHRVAAAAERLGWGLHGVVPSRLPGSSGNLEYFLWMRRGHAALAPQAIDQAVSADPGGERVAW